MSRPISKLSLTEIQLVELNRILSRPTSSQRLVRRCRIILQRGSGSSQAQVASLLGITRTVVSHWENRFRQGGFAGLNEAKRSGRKSSISEDIKSKIITTATTPPAGHTQWSTRKIARAQGVSNQTVHKLWVANGIKPHIKQASRSAPLDQMAQ